MIEVDFNKVAGLEAIVDNHDAAAVAGYALRLGAGCRSRFLAAGATLVATSIVYSGVVVGEASEPTVGAVAVARALATCFSEDTGDRGEVALRP